MSEKINGLSKKTKKIIGILIIIIIGIIISLIFFSKINKKVIYINSYSNFAWGAEGYGYKIYSNGIIEEYDEHNSEAKLKRAKISKEELLQLKKLANSVEDDYIDSNSFAPNSYESIINAATEDAGVTEKKIYNNEEKKWITLSQSGDTVGHNDTEEAKKIIELTELLYKKYLKDNK